MNYMVNIEDMRNRLGNDIKIISFPDLEKYNDINELLPKKKDYCIIFYIEDNKDNIDIGHWTCLYKYNNVYYFFDSYGINENNELSYIPKNKRIKYNENINYLHNLLKNKNVINNKYQYQKFKNNINTCGRYVLIILYLFIYKNIYNFDDIHKILLKYQRKYNFKSMDELSVFLTD